MASFPRYFIWEAEILLLIFVKLDEVEPQVRNKKWFKVDDFDKRLAFPV